MSILTSELVLQEVRKHWLEKFRKDVEKTDRRFNLARVASELVDPLPLESPVCRNPEVDWILALAVSGHAHFLITGDMDLLVLHPFRGIPVILPAAFAAQEEFSRRLGTDD